MARVVVTRSNHTGGLSLVAAVVVAVATAGAVLVVALGALVVWLAVRHPFCAAALGGSALAVAGGGWPAALGLWAAVAAGALLWRWRDRAGFDRAVLRRWRRTFVYGRRWRRAMVACALDGPGEWRRPVPRLGAVRSTRWTDTVRVHLLDGQTPELVAARAPHLAAALGARSCRVRDDGAGAVTLELRRGDPLSRPLPPLPVPDRPDLDALVVGTHEDGAPWTVRLARGHLLVAGAPGTGDGTGRESVVWSLVRSLAARVRDGSVELWGVDGGGPDLRIGAPLFTRLAAGDRDPGIAVVEDAAALVHERRPGPGRDDPLVVLVLDDLAVWADGLDDDTRRRLRRPVEQILTRGAAAGVVVVATVRTASPSLAAWFRHVVRVGPDGVALAAEGRAAAARVRAAAVPDTEVAAMADRFRPGPRGPRPDAGRSPAPPAIGPPAADDDSAAADVRRIA